jgi:hypothetical protein
MVQSIVASSAVAGGTSGNRHRHSMKEQPPCHEAAP